MESSIIDAIKRSFQNVKTDFTSLRDSVNSWILYLNNHQSELNTKILALEERIKELEQNNFLQIKVKR